MINCNVTVVDVSVVRDNYHVKLEMPNGILFTVMIPLDFAKLPNPDFPFGLNLFSTGHYRKHYE
jgi:hypothetical protein